MTGTVKPNPVLKQALLLRESGYSVATITQKTGVSATTLNRLFRKVGAPKGTLTKSSVEEARAALLNDSAFISELKARIAASLLDDLAHITAIRAAMAEALEETMGDIELPAHAKARSIAALATSLTLTQKASRIALGVDNQPVEQSELPTLEISELTLDDIEDMRRQQDELNVLTGVALPANTDTEDNEIVEEE